MKIEDLKFIIDDDKKVIETKDITKDFVVLRRFSQLIWIGCGFINCIGYFNNRDMSKLIWVFIGLLWLYLFITDLKKSFEKNLQFDEINKIIYKNGLAQGSLRIKLKNNKTRIIYCDLSNKKLEEMKILFEKNLLEFQYK